MTFVYTLPSLLHVKDVLGQTDIEGLRQKENQTTAEDPGPSEDQRRKKKNYTCSCVAFSKLHSYMWGNYLTNL